MRLALTNRSLIAAIVLIAVTAAAFAVACTDGVHTPGGSIGDVCATMTHSSALEAVANANSTPLAISALAVAFAGFAVLLLGRPGLLQVAHSVAELGRSPASLNGRLRL